MIVCWLLCITCHISSADKTKQVHCEELGENSWSPTMTANLCCFMHSNTVIDSPWYSISSRADTNVGTLLFQGNREIYFLPINIAEKFVNLKLYNAADCSIEIIRKENFKALRNMRQLHLNRNRIEKVASDTFEDMTELELVYLRK